MNSKQTLKIYLDQVDSTAIPHAEKVKQRLKSLDKIYGSKRLPLPRLNLKQRKRSQFDMTIHRRVSSQIDRVLAPEEDSRRFKSLRRESFQPTLKSPTNNVFMRNVAERTAVRENNRTVSKEKGVLNRTTRPNQKKFSQFYFHQPALITQNHHKQLLTPISPIELRQVKQICGYILILLVRLDSDGIRIMAVPRDDPSSQPRMIRMNRQDTKIYLDRHCQGRVEKIFQCLTYNGEELAI